jgi:hypothetical protein
MLLENLSKRISAAATGRTTAIVSALSVAYLLPYLNLAFKGIQNKGPLLDQRFFSTPEYVQHTLTSYGPSLRAEYLRGEFWDILIAGVAFAIALVVSYGFKRVGWSTRFNLIPIAAAALNTLKIACFVPMILAYAHEPRMLVWLANGVNVPKNIAILSSLILLVVAIGTIIYSKARPRT